MSLYIIVFNRNTYSMKKLNYIIWILNVYHILNGINCSPYPIIKKVYIYIYTYLVSMNKLYLYILLH